MKKRLESRIRGWLPKEPKLPNQSSSIQTQTPQPKPIPKHKLSRLSAVAITVSANLFVIFNFFLGFSIVQIILVAVTVAFTFAFLLVKRTSCRTVCTILKYSAIFIFAFAFCFSGLGLYIFQTSGYPPTYVPRLVYPNVLNASLAEYFRSVEQSESFQFLQFQHLGTLVFGKLTLTATSTQNSQGSTGWLEWTFYPKDTGTYILMGNNGGQSYYTSSQRLFHEVVYKNFPSIQNMEIVFRQIDSLGLSWFQNQASLTYQNQTGSKPPINGLNVVITYDNLNNYRGIIILLNARTFDYDNRGNKVYPSIFSAEFEPNGTLLSFTK